jgi:hypothetical protein
MAQAEANRAARDGLPAHAARTRAVSGGQQRDHHRAARIGQNARPRRRNCCSPFFKKKADATFRKSKPKRCPSAWNRSRGCATRKAAWPIFSRRKTRRGSSSITARFSICCARFRSWRGWKPRCFSARSKRPCAARKAPPAGCIAARSPCRFSRHHRNEPPRHQDTKGGTEQSEVINERTVAMSTNPVLLFVSSCLCGSSCPRAKKRCHFAKAH